MFWTVCDPSSGNTELCLTEITLGGSQIFFVCLVGVWQRNFEPAVCVTKFHSHTTQQAKLLVLYVLIFIFLDSKLEDKTYCTK